MGGVGKALSEENLKEYFEKVLDKLKKIDEEKKAEIKIWLTICRPYFTQYRNNPAHYGNEIIINYEKLIQKTETILEIINELIKRLIDVDLVK